MKLFFLNHDTLHKIFSTIEKIPRHSTVRIFVEHQNQLFNNNRRAKQLKKLIEEREINALFVTDNIKQKDYYDRNHLLYEFKEESKWRRLLKLIYLFFFNIKKFHITIHQQRDYTFFAVFGAEILFLLLIIYLLYSLVLPKTTITLTPAYQIDEIVYNFRYIPKESLQDYPLPNSHITIPYQYGTTVVSKSLTIDGSKIDYTNIPAKGQVRIVNTTSSPLSLIKGTQLMTEDGLLFTIDKAITIIPSLGAGKASYTYVNATAKDRDLQGQFIGSRGNISTHTSLIIKNLKQSKYTKEIYAETTQNFSGGSLIKSGSITQGDIGILQKKMYDDIQINALSSIQKNNSTDKSHITIPFQELITVSGCDYQGLFNTLQISNQTAVGGTLYCTLLYPYVSREDMKKAIESYLQKRQSYIHTIVSINPDSLHFIQLITGEYNAYIIPTKVNIVQGYDFTKDINGIISSLKENIIGMSKDQAKQVILGYPEISNVEVGINPPRYTVISNIKSRISIKTTPLHQTN